MGIFSNITDALKKSIAQGKGPAPSTPTIDPALQARLLQQGQAGTTRLAQIANPTVTNMNSTPVTYTSSSSLAQKQSAALPPVFPISQPAKPAVNPPFKTPAPVAPAVQTYTPPTPAVPAVNARTGGVTNPAPAAQNNPNPARPATPTQTAESTPYSGAGASTYSPAPASENPPPPQQPGESGDDYQKRITDAEAAYQKNTELTPEELKAQEDIDALNESYKTAFQNTAGQTIPLEFITGQQKSLEERALNLQEPLKAKLARLQAKRQSALDASKFALDRLDKQGGATEVGGNLVRRNPTTGAYETVYKGPSTAEKPVVLGADQKLVDPTTGREIAMGTAKAGAAGDANALKTNALASAQQLLQKFLAGEGTSAVGKSRLLGYGAAAPAGTAAANFQIQFKNLKSLLSLDNVKYLKGQGQVSDAERRLLSEAAAKLELAQSEPEFQAALQDVIKALSGPGESVSGTGEYSW